jgi:hypothetical protein
MSIGVSGRRWWRIPVSPIHRNIIHVAAAAALVLSVGGCTIPFKDAGAEQVNVCGSTDECGVDSVCADTDFGALCAATKADLAGVIFEIRTAADDIETSRSYVIDPSAQGASLQSTLYSPVVFDPQLPQLVSITTGEVNCKKDNTSIPANVEFTRVLPIAGPRQETYSAFPEQKGTDPSGTDPSFAFHLDVDPGNYDIYVTPVEVAPGMPPTCGGAPLPPVFIASKAVEVNSTFRLEVNPARHLTGTIEVADTPDKMDLHGWSLQVFDMKSGRLISETQTLDHSDPTVPAKINLHYNLTTGVSPIIRLKPPADAIGPGVYWDLAAADLQGQDKVTLELSELAITPREVQGHVFDADENVVIAAITFQSISLSGDTFKNAAFTVTTETDAKGFFQVNVPPGKYHVVAQPLSDDSQAIAETTWDIPQDPSCFCGQSVTLPNKVMLTGEVLTPTQGPLLAATAVASPSLPPRISQLDRELGREKILPREASTPFVDGQFALALDPGEYDFSVTPPVESGYPWLVRPRVSVVANSEDASSSLGAISVAHPVVVTGVVTDSSGVVVPNATIRAWLPVKTKEGVAPTAIEIGATVANVFGRYTLLLPPSISQ